MIEKSNFCEILFIKIKILIQLLSYRLNVYYNTKSFN